MVEDDIRSFQGTSIIGTTTVESCTPILGEDHQFSECADDDVDVRVDFSPPILTDIHTHDSDTRDAERESG